MKLITVISFIVLLLCGNFALAHNKSEIADYIAACRKDLDFFQSSLQKNSAAYANKSDVAFQKWYKEGYKNTLKLLDSIGDRDDCYYAMKYYVNGFQKSHISLRGYVPLPDERYPGILSVRRGGKHFIIFKHHALDYLSNVSVGDKVTHINDIEIEKYYKDYLLPFYANDKSDLTLESASVYALILDGNRFKPIAKTITLNHEGRSVKIELKYTELKGSALAAVKKIRQPRASDLFKVEMVSNGVWIRIPSFFPNLQESVYYTGMLSKLKNDLAKEDYILFDMRGNRGGASKWSRPIIRNLWGDDFIKHLGKRHDYNIQWQKLLRVSQDNFNEFKRTYGASASKTYAASLKKNENFYLKKWSIFRDKDNLYTNEDSRPFNAKIYVLTDNFCRSTCWSFVNELRQMPNVIHIGAPTMIQSVYSFARQERSPSQDFDFFYPIQIRVKPEYQLGLPLVPSHIYKGDFRDEAKLIDWVLSITEKK